MSPQAIVAFVPDLADRSRLAIAIPGVVFATRLDDAVGAGTVVIDLGRSPVPVAEARSVAPSALIVCFGPHVDVEAAAAARAAGADRVMPRSRFFRDPAAALIDTF